MTRFCKPIDSPERHIYQLLMMTQCLKNQELSDAGEQVGSNIFIVESKNPRLMAVGILFLANVH